MKKLLSIIAITGGILAFTLPTVTACKSNSKPKPPVSTKFDLSKLIVTGIQVTKATSGANNNKLQINVQQAYNKIVAKIIEIYQIFGFKNDDLKVSNFAYGDKIALTKEKTWAIQIMDGNGTAMTLPTTSTDMTNIFSTTPTVIAYKSKSTSQPLRLAVSKFDLTNVNVTGINVTSHQNRLQINIKDTYQKIIREIIGGYNAFGFKDKKVISEQDFNYGTTFQANKSWAVAVMQSDKTTMIPAPSTSSNEHYLTNDNTKAAANKVLLPDNALNVKIKTTNNNVKEKLAIAHIYLNKFVYTGANINKGVEIETSPILADNIKTVLDVSSDLTGLSITAATDASHVETEFARIVTEQTTATAISTKVLTALNNQLKDETKTLNAWNILKPTTTETIDFAQAPSMLYRLNVTTNEVTVISGQDKAAANDLIFIRLMDLHLSSYIGWEEYGLFLKIGTVTS